MGRFARAAVGVAHHVTVDQQRVSLNADRFTTSTASKPPVRNLAFSFLRIA